MTDEGALILAVAIAIGSMAGCTAVERAHPQPDFMSTCAQSRMICTQSQWGGKTIVRKEP